MVILLDTGTDLKHEAIFIALDFWLLHMNLK